MTQTNWIHQMWSHQTWWLTLPCVMIVFINLEVLNAFAFLWLNVQDCPVVIVMQLNQLWDRKKRKKKKKANAVWHVHVVSLARKAYQELVAQTKLWFSLCNCSSWQDLMDSHTLYYQHQYYYSDCQTETVRWYTRHMKTESTIIYHKDESSLWVDVWSIKIEFRE